MKQCSYYMFYLFRAVILLLFLNPNYFLNIQIYYESYHISLVHRENGQSLLVLLKLIYRFLLPYKTNIFCYKYSFSSNKLDSLCIDINRQ